MNQLPYYKINFIEDIYQYLDPFEVIKIKIKDMDEKETFSYLTNYNKNIKIFMNECIHNKIHSLVSKRFHAFRNMNYKNRYQAKFLISITNLVSKKKYNLKIFMKKYKWTLASYGNIHFKIINFTNSILFKDLKNRFGPDMNQYDSDIFGKMNVLYQDNNEWQLSFDFFDIYGWCNFWKEEYNFIVEKIVQK